MADAIAIVVFPVPLAPVNRNAVGNGFAAKFVRMVRWRSRPTKSARYLGLYFSVRAQGNGKACWGSATDMARLAHHRLVAGGGHRGHQNALRRFLARLRVEQPPRPPLTFRNHLATMSRRLFG
jgi:hypothetical protein